MTLKDHGWDTIIVRDHDSDLTCEGVLTDAYGRSICGARKTPDGSNRLSAPPW